MERRQTRRRGEAAQMEPIFAKVDPAVKAKVNAVAAALGVSQARAVELMLGSIEVNAHGRPAFYEGDLPSDAQGEFPLASVS